MKKLILTIFLTLLLLSCKKRVIIEHNVTLDSYLTDEYAVRTTVLVTNYFFWPQTIEYYEISFVDSSDINFTKIIQLEKAKNIKFKVLKILENK